MLSRYGSLRQGLVGAWCPSLGASGYRLLDRSGNNNHGTLTNMDPGTDWVPSGGKLALDFDGVDDYIDCGQCNGINYYITVTAWVLWRNLGTSSYYPMIICKPSSATWTSPFSDWSLRLEGTLKRVTFGINNLGVAANIVNGSTVITVDSIWHHVAGVYDGTNLQIYVDGQLDGTKALSITSINNSGRNVLMGARQGFGEWNNGQLDDVRIYNRALTPSEIRLLYTGGRGVGLVPERIKHRRKTSAAATNRRRRLICGANC